MREAFEQRKASHESFAFGATNLTSIRPTASSPAATIPQCSAQRCFHETLSNVSRSPELACCKRAVDRSL